MAKKTTPKVDTGLLSAIASATETAPNYCMFVPQDSLNQFGSFTPPLVEANAGMANESGIATRITEAGKAYLANKGQAGQASAPEAAPSTFQLFKLTALPTNKRGARAGAQSKYPFEQMELNDTFFVPKSADTPDPLKTLSSTVNSVNGRYAVETGEFKDQTRAKRGKGNKLELGSDGNKVMETKRVPVTRQERKFTVRSVKAGTVIEGWTAPADGVIVARIM